MESLALVAVVLVAPALFGGPLALCLTLWRLNQASNFRLIFAGIVATLSALSGTFFLVNGISQGSTYVGLFGVGCSLWTFLRIRSKLKQG